MDTRDTLAKSEAVGLTVDITDNLRNLAFGPVMKSDTAQFLSMISHDTDWKVNLVTSTVGSQNSSKEIPIKRCSTSDFEEFSPARSD